MWSCQCRPVCEVAPLGALQEVRIDMSMASVVIEEIDEPTSHAVVAAQLRGEAKVEGDHPDLVVSAIATELEDLGLEPDRTELERRYQIGQTKVPESLRQRM